MTKKILILLLIAPALALAGASSPSGGQDIGGGDNETGHVTAGEVASAIALYESRRLELFRALRLAGLAAERVLAIEPRLRRPLPPNERADLIEQREVYRLLFADPDRAFAIVEGVRTEIRVNGPCYDRLGGERDGSIFANPPFNLCMSASRIAPRTDRSRARAEILGLYLHEISHLLGTNEDQADTLQRQILAIGPNSASYFAFLREEPNEFRDAIRATALEADAISAAMPDDELCERLTALQERMTKHLVDGTVGSLRTATLSLEGTIAFHSAFVLSGFASDYCESDRSSRKAARLRKFGGSTSAPIAALYPDPLLIIPPIDPDVVLKTSQYLLADLSSAEVARPDHLNREALARNLASLKTALAEAIRAGRN